MIETNRLLVAVSCLVLSISQLTPADAQTLVPDATTCGGCSISVVPVVKLGTTDGPGALGDIVRVEVDGRGRYWVFSSAHPPVVFEPTGRPIGEVARYGGGPGEARAPRSIWQLPGDSTALVDASGQLSIFDPSLRYQRTVVNPIRGMFAAQVLDWPRRVLVNAMIRTPNEVGIPLHVLNLAGDRPRIETSFGASRQQKVTPATFAAIPQLITRPRNGYFWTASSSTYTLTRWDAELKPVMVLRRRPTWFSEPSDLLNGGPNHPPSPRLIGLGEDPTGLLWSICLVPSPDYAEAWANVPRQRGSGGVSEIRAAAIDFSKLHYTTVEVIDPRTPAVVASTTLRRRPISTLPDARLAFAATLPDGTPVVEVVQLRLNQ